LGPGFDVIEKIDQDIHLGILGMRERVESLGGSFQVESKLGQGTKISANIRLHIPEGHNE
jgi:two-component system sensor histidine kinase ComP